MANKDKEQAKDRGFWYNLGDNLIGYEDEVETPGEKLGKNTKAAIEAVGKDPLGVLKALGVGLKEEAEDIAAGPVAYAKTDRVANPDGTVPLTKKEKEDQILSVLGLAAAPATPALKAAGKIPDPTFLNSFKGNNPPTYAKKNSSALSENRVTNALDNPLYEYISEITIPKKGLLGSEFIRGIKNEESINSNLIKYYGLEKLIDPNKRYTGREIIEAVAGSNIPDEDVFRFRDNFHFSPEYEDYQRQRKHAGYLPDDELLYEEIVISNDSPKYQSKNNHFPDIKSNLGHVRISLREGGNPSGDWGLESDGLFRNDEKYILVEEIQSDTIGKGKWIDRPEAIKDTPPEKSFKEIKDNRFKTVDEEIRFQSEVEMITPEEGVKLKELADKAKKLYTYALENESLRFGDLISNYRQSIGLESLDKDLVDRWNNTARMYIARDGNSFGFLSKIFRERSGQAHALLFDSKELITGPYGYPSSRFVMEALFTPLSRGKKGKPVRVEPPLKSDKDITDLGLKAILAKAEEYEADYIVIPPVERIMMARGIDPATNSALKFDKLYGNALQKSLKELKENYPSILIEKRKLPYTERAPSLTGFDDNDNPIFREISDEGYVLDISRLRSEVDLRKPRFNEGGVVMDPEVDPVSGNEVPIGAKPEEVRDDVPINASEGEYVIPANVVRYFGVSHFEKLIEKANKGLAEMAEKGRMGNEPEEPVGEEPIEMADGGMIPPYNPAQMPTGFSTFGTQGGTTAGAPAVENKIYMGPDGSRRVIMFINGQPVNDIPDGYVPDTPENRRAQELASEEAVKAAKREGGTTGAENAENTPDPADYAGMTPEGRAAAVSAGDKFAGVLGAMFGGPLGAQAARALHGKSVRDTMKDQELSDKEIEDALGKRGLLDRITGKTSSKSSDVSFDPDTGMFSKDGIEVSKDLMDRVSEAVNSPTPATSAPSAPSPSGVAGDTDGDGDVDGDDGVGYGGADSDAFGYNKGGLVTKPKGKRTKKSSGKGLATRC